MSNGRLEATLEIIERILARIGIGTTPIDAVLIGHARDRNAALLSDPDQAGLFLMHFALDARFRGYSEADLRGLTLLEVAERYARESYPEPPDAAVDDAVQLFEPDRIGSTDEPPLGAPIVFVLGCGRSGTTLLRAMLGRHGSLWAPGELHLANYADMSQRAARIAPPLRFMPVPEIAERLGESRTSMQREFERWEGQALPVARVYELLVEASSESRVVDKTPTYSGSLECLERIGRLFPNARFIELVRSPTDVVRSLVRMQLYKGVADPELNAYHAAELIWTRNHTNIRSFFERVPAPRRATVRYEDLVARPAPELARLCDLLGLGYEERMANPYATSDQRIARGAGDMQVNFLDKVEKRSASQAFYPMGVRSRRLAESYGY